MTSFERQDFWGPVCGREAGLVRHYGTRSTMQGVPAIAAKSKRRLRLLRFWVKVPNTSSEIGTTLSRARACGRMQIVQ